MTKRKVTKFTLKQKRELLTKALVVQEEQEKIDAAQKRLWQRSEKANERARAIAEDLASGLHMNGESRNEPISYKGYSFELKFANSWDHTRTLVIQKLNKV